jgi:hypothetical protein
MDSLKRFYFNIMVAIRQYDLLMLKYKNKFDIIITL